MPSPLRRRLALVVCAVVLSLGALPTFGQSTGADPGLPDLRPVIQRLGPGSFYAEGCVDPCDCAVLRSDDLRGTFRLLPGGDDAPGRFRVVDLFWLVTDSSGEELVVRGHGTLSVGDAALILDLSLRLGDAPPVRYRGRGSSAGFPRLDVTLRVPDATCRTTWFRVRSAPVPPDQILPYDLALGSSYAYGCISSGCACPVTQRPMAGPFAMVPLGEQDGFRELALVEVRWRLSALPGDPSAGDPVRGVGVYRVRRRAHEMLGEFRIGEDRPEMFRSGPQRGASPPTIDITMRHRQDRCISEELHVIGAPSPRPRP